VTQEVKQEVTLGDKGSDMKVALEVSQQVT